MDLGVYSRNRAFRLYLSSKAGKEAVLDCTGGWAWARVHLHCAVQLEGGEGQGFAAAGSGEALVGSSGSLCGHGG